MAQTASAFSLAEAGPSPPFWRRGRRTSGKLTRQGENDDPSESDPTFIPYRGALSPPVRLPSLLPSAAPIPPPTYPSPRKRRATISAESAKPASPLSPRSPAMSHVQASYPRAFPPSGGIGESPVSSKAALQQQQASHSPFGRRSRGGSTSSSVETVSSSRKSRDGPVHAGRVSGERHQPRASSSATVVHGGRERSGSTATTTSMLKPISDPVRAPSPSHAYTPSRAPPPRPRQQPPQAQAFRLPFSSSSPDLRNLAHSQPPTAHKKSSKQLVYEASTMCDTFVYPQPKLKPFLITPPSSPSTGPPTPDRRPSGTAGDPPPVSAPPKKDFLSRFPSARRSTADRRPSLPNIAASTPDEASDLRLLREGHEREQEKIAWAAAARKGSVSRSGSTLGRKRSGSAAAQNRGGESALGMSTGSTSTTRGPKRSFDFLSKPPPGDKDKGRSGRSSAPLEELEKAHVHGGGGPRKISSQGDLRAAAEAASPSSRQDRLGAGEGGGPTSVRKPPPGASASLAHIFIPTENPHPFLGRPLPSSTSHSSVVDIRPDGLWDALSPADAPPLPSGSSSSSSNQSQPRTAQLYLPEQEPFRYEIGQAISPDPPPGSSSASSSNSTQRTHRRYASQASRSISSLDAFHARFPPSPTTGQAGGPALGADGARRTHGRASTVSPATMRAALPGLASAPPLEPNRSWGLEAQEAGAGPRKVASSSSMRVHPSTSGNVLAPSPAITAGGEKVSASAGRGGWTFPPSPAASPNPMQQQHSRGGSGSFSRPLVQQQQQEGSPISQYAPTRRSGAEEGGPLFHYEDYEGLFFEPPQTPQYHSQPHAPPPSSVGDNSDVDDDENDNDRWVPPPSNRESHPPIVRNVSVSNRRRTDDPRYSVQSITGEMGDLSAADFPRPPPPAMPVPLDTGTSDVASFFTAASRMNSSS